MKKAITVKQKAFQIIKYAIIRAANFVDRPIISHLRKRGIPTYYWVCNS